MSSNTARRIEPHSDVPTFRPVEVFDVVLMSIFLHIESPHCLWVQVCVSCKSSHDRCVITQQEEKEEM